MNVEQLKRIDEIKLSFDRFIFVNTDKYISNLCLLQEEIKLSKERFLEFINLTLTNVISAYVLLNKYKEKKSMRDHIAGIIVSNLGDYLGYQVNEHITDIIEFGILSLLYGVTAEMNNLQYNARMPDNSNAPILIDITEKMAVFGITYAEQNEFGW